MKYKTSDLSKMLDVSANTIRRFEDKGYLSPDRDDKNQYRYFGNEDIEKITYISKYRKIGFSHDDIADMMNGDIFENCNRHRARMEEMDREIERLKSIRHMLKDNIGMIEAIERYQDSFYEMASVPVHYVLYKVADELVAGAGKKKLLHQFIYDFPEIEYIYIIRKEDILQRRIRCEEGVAVRAKWTDKRNMDMNQEGIEHYPRLDSVLRIVKLPLDFMNEDFAEKEQIKKLIFDDYFDYMKEHGYRLAGDAFGAKMGLSKEDGREYQYVVLGMPVEPEM